MKRIYKRTATLISAGILFCSSFAQACDTVDTVNAQEYEDGSDNVIEWDAYGQTIYNTTNGLISNHVSSIEQTGDGVVWIGTDEGLSAYDGNEFTTYGGFYHFDGINDMVRTADGGIWYATTTYGGAIYLGSRFQHFDDVSEQVSNYATSIAEGVDGTIYVGTLRGMLLIHPASGYTLTVLGGEDYFYVNSIAAGRQTTGALTINGDVVFFNGDTQVKRYSEVFSGQACIYYADGYYLIGTSDGKILIFDEKRLDEGVIEEYSVPLNASAGSDTAINDFFYEANGRLWVLSNGGIGYYALGSDGISTIKSSNFIQCTFDNFESGFTDMMMDYQGNYWISSSKRGVLLLCKSDFTDELWQLGLDIDRMNAVYEKDGILYGATDSGLITIDRRDKAVVDIDWTDALRGMKLMDVTAYDDKLYVAVYGKGVYTEKEYLPVEAERINRLQVVDGQLYIMSDEGCIVWDGNRVTENYSQDDGLYNTHITCVLTGAFGRRGEEYIYLGSRGAGIFAFSDGELKKCMDENFGLPSKNINDMLAYENGFFIATDSGIAYYNGRKMAELSRLPEGLEKQACENLFINSGMLYVICRNAVYVIDLDDLFNGDKQTDLKYSLYDENAGFFGVMTDGGHGCIDEEGRIYLPCSEKIYSLSGSTEETDIGSLKILLQSVKTDKRSVELVQFQENEYAVTIGKDAEEIDIFCSVLNFSNADPNVRYILHGVDNKYTTIRSSELEHIIYENLEGGTYTFWFELLDDEGETADRIILTINKEQKLIEKLWVRMALLASAFGILMYFVFKGRKKN